MEGIQFDEPQDIAVRRTVKERIDAISRLFIKWGWAKNEQRAEVLMLAIAVAAFAVMFGIWILSTPHEPPLQEPVGVRSI